MENQNHHIRIMGLFLCGIIVLGWLGYWIMVPAMGPWDAMYQLIMTISTTGFTDRKLFSGDGQPNVAAHVLTAFLMMASVFLSVTVLGFVTSVLLARSSPNAVRRRKAMAAVKSMDGHFVICGAQDTGHHVIEELQSVDANFVVIDEDEDRIQRLEDHFPGILIIKGDPSEDEVLNAAEIEKAKGVVVSMATDKETLFVTLSVRQINPTCRIISKCIDPLVKPKFMKVGASSVVSPLFIGGLRMASEMIRPATVTFLDHMLKAKKATRIEDVKVSRLGDYEGKSLLEINIHHVTGVLVLAVKHRDEAEFSFNPKASEKVFNGTRLIVLGTMEQVKHLREFV